MEKMIAYCGIICSECPAFIATKNNDDEAKIKLAKEWSEMYKSEMKPEDIDCDGCLATTERHVGYCNTCEIRKCASQKSLLNCAYCSDYPCSQLSNFFEMAKEAKINLEELRKSL